MQSKHKIKNKIKATPHTDVKQSLEYPGTKNQQIYCNFHKYRPTIIIFSWLMIKKWSQNQTFVVWLQISWVYVCQNYGKIMNIV